MSCCWLFGVILISSSLESSYIRLNCQSAEIVRNRKWSPLKWKYDMSDGTYHYWRPEALKNGSWNSFSFYEPRASWGLGLDRFVDDLWIPEVDSPVSPAIFENETNIEAGPTRLLFQADFSTWFNYEAQFICDVRQDYVESRVNCSRRDASARQNCTVTGQRPSQRRHAPENISPLSFIDVFRHVSYLLPRGASGLSFNNVDLSIQYLIDPKLIDLGRTPTSAGFQALNGQQLGSRLSQLLNTYVQLSQMHMATSVGSINNGTLLEANITAPVEVANLVEVYVVSNLWAALSILSSIVLILGGVASVIFAHLAIGPEIFGYASTVLRDSRFINLPSTARRMPGSDMRLMVEDLMIRIGFISLEENGERVLGVGREEETRPIKERGPKPNDESSWEFRLLN